MVFPPLIIRAAFNGLSVFSPGVFFYGIYIRQSKETTESSLQISHNVILPKTTEIFASRLDSEPSRKVPVSHLHHHVPPLLLRSSYTQPHCSPWSSWNGPPIFLWKMTIPLKYGTSSHGTLRCDSTAPESQLIFPQGASISASKCCWLWTIICAVIKLNPLLGLALSLNNTSVWVIHSQGTNTSPGRSLSMMYWRNTSECTPAIRIYGHHTSRWGWVVMYGSEDGTVQQWTRPGPRG